MRTALPPKPAATAQPAGAAASAQEPSAAAAAAAAEAAAAAAPAPPGADADAEAARADALWRALPRARRAAYALHVALRMLWLASMGDPSFFQDAMDVIGAPPMTPLSLWAAVQWAAYYVRRLALRALSLVAALSRAMALGLHRWVLWRWPGPHRLLLAAADGGALAGVSVFDARGALARTLRFGRDGVSTRFYRRGAAATVGGGPLGAAELAALAARLARGAAVAGGAADGSSGSSGGDGGGAGGSAAQPPEVGDLAADEVVAAADAARLALACLGRVDGGRIGERLFVDSKCLRRVLSKLTAAQ